MRADEECASGSVVRSRRKRVPAHRSALAALALLVAALAACGVLPFYIDGGAVYAAPVLSPTETSTATAMATATATAAPPTLTLLSPTARFGPAGARVTVAGANFGSGQVGIFASVHSVCDTQQAVLGSTTANGGAFSAYTFIWPTALPPEQYYICATGMTGGAPGFWEQTSAPPTLSLSPTTIQAGQTVTISGSSFEGAQTVTVKVLLQQGTTVHDIQTVTPASDGTFSVEYTPDGSLTNAVVLLASSPAENGAPPALEASATLTILPGGTATVGTTPSPQVSQTPSGPVPPGKGQNDSGSGLLVVLFAVFGLAVLAGLGLAAFFVLRGRGPAGPALAYPGGAPGPGGPGGYATSGGMTGVSERQTGHPGGYGPVDRWDQPAMPQVGAVAGWADDPRPGPDWRPRPMSGQRRDWDEDTAGTYGDDSPTNVSLYWQDESRQPEGERAGEYAPDAAAPADPWADQSSDDLYSGQGATNPASSLDDEDQWTQLQPGRKRQVPAWHDEPGPGTTRPDNQAESQPVDAAASLDEQPAPPAPQTAGPVDPTPPAEPD